MSDETRDIYSISRLNSELRHVLEGSFPLLWIEGEISNLATPRSGHLYFSLKDPNAQIRCALFRNRRNLLRFKPENGSKVLVRAKVALYEPRGDCQLIIEHMEPAGDGALRQAYEQLKEKLQLEGLFNAERKLPLPAFPRRIGIISSPSGAAVRDVLQVLARRYPSARITLYPSSVQGINAAAELREALHLALRRENDDVLILTRGGGALEDLAAFNDEALARLIAEAQIPIVSAVGHEIDFTIADFVADRRAPTPSAAAELVSPDSIELSHRFGQWEARLRQLILSRLRQSAVRLQHTEVRLKQLHPGVRLRQQQQRLDELQLRLTRFQRAQFTRLRQMLGHASRRLLAQHPSRRLGENRIWLMEQYRRLRMLMQRDLRVRRDKLASRARELQAVSPLATLQRGYSITTSGSGQVVTAASQVSRGERIAIRLADGSLEAEVSATLPGKPD